MHSVPSGLLGLATALLAGCTPALDWREVRTAHSTAVFPCRPDRQERSLALAGRPVRMALLSCAADGSTFALAEADTGSADAVGPALAALKGAAMANLGASAARPASAAEVAGATPNAESARLVLEGRLPDGSAATAHALFFCRGTVVAQATVFGARPAAEAAGTFFDGLRGKP